MGPGALGGSHAKIGGPSVGLVLVRLPSIVCPSFQDHVKGHRVQREGREDRKEESARVGEEAQEWVREEPLRRGRPLGSR